MPLKVGTRPSPLALIQVREVVSLFRHRGGGIAFEVVRIHSDGDLDKKTPFSGIEGTDFFTRQIEEALLQGEVDLAVHSAKDLEDDMPEELMIAVITRSLSPYECLVTKGKESLSTLPAGSRVGTSSKKRKEALLAYRPDFQVFDVRGNIDERLRQLDEGKYEAVIMAHAALIRLGYEERIAQIISPDILPPHPLQGSLAVQIRKDRSDLFDMFRRMHAE